MPSSSLATPALVLSPLPLHTSPPSLTSLRAAPHSLPFQPFHSSSVNWRVVRSPATLVLTLSLLLVTKTFLSSPLPCAPPFPILSLSLSTSPLFPYPLYPPSLSFPLIVSRPFPTYTLLSSTLSSLLLLSLILPHSTSLLPILPHLHPFLLPLPLETPLSPPYPPHLSPCLLPFCLPPSLFPITSASLPLFPLHCHRVTVAKMWLSHPRNSSKS